MENHIINRTTFWIELWEDLIKDFLKKSFGLSLQTPHTLIEDIITEIEENSFKNKNNKEYFYSKINDYSENDPVIKKQFASKFKLLRSNFNSDRTKLILEIAKNIKVEFEKGKYFDNNLELLCKHLNKNEPIDIQFISDIKNLTQNVIVEFIIKGYSLKDTEKFSSNIFDEYHLHSKISNTYYSNFPHNINHNIYISNDGVYDYEKFNKELKKIIDNLTTEKRIRTLSYYYYKAKERANYIFEIRGIKGSALLKIAGVTFYSLDKKRFITKEASSAREILNSKNKDNEEKFVQVSVEIDDYLLPNSSLSKALNKLENAIDLINCYINNKTSIEVNSSNYIIEQNGDCVFGSWSANKEAKKIMDSLDLKDYEEYLLKINKHSFLWDLKKPNTNTKLLNAIHWYSKAEQATRQEDKILNYWIAIESLFKKDKTVIDEVIKSNRKSEIQLIQEIVSANKMFSFIYDYGWEVYYYYSNSVQSVFNKNPYGFSEELILKANLKTRFGEKIYLNKFVQHLGEINKLEKDIFKKQQNQKIIDFYSESTTSIKVIQNQISVIKNDILMIYRLRNLIVHNAHFNNALLPYYVWKAKNYTGSIIRELISTEDIDDNKISNALINIYLRKEELLLDLKNNTVDLFKI
ncbi:hypothetical protein GCM10011416_11820 [Polaribacter pacificus]|uniref:Apea-like HEPN domain-containing protein n=1 Tax=Polaribacter pacificus TaxID=1775173 RepID=A0A917HYJ3_9FLAO|nr:HEPN domain-containing protein [Polaribacter pacificus]GGG95790.1 hypothetical protein GCM10011416_11820 [Polaribacter pacificus]